MAKDKETKTSSTFAGTTIYFEPHGPVNTEAALDAAFGRAAALGLTDIVVASNQGVTAKAAVARLGRIPGLNLVIVTHHVGFHEPGHDEMDQATRAELAAAGAKILTTTHLFGGVERGVVKKFGGQYPGVLIANTLRLFGEGTKVAVEIACMALDSGFVPYGHDVVAVGGTGRGADTVLVVRPSHSGTFFETRIVETVCRPLPRR